MSRVDNSRAKHPKSANPRKARLAKTIDAINPAGIERKGVERSRRGDSAFPMTHAASELMRIYKEVPVGLCYFDTDLRFVLINDLLATLNGMPASEHISRTIGEVLPDVAAGVESQLRQVIETGEPIVGGTVEAETPAQPGTKRTFQHNYYPVRADDGTVVGVTCVVEDVTERMRAEEAVRRAHDELEQRVEERTAELQRANDDLISQRQLLSSIADNIPGNVFRRVLHRDGSIAYPYISANFGETYNLDAEKGMADPNYILDAIHPDDREAFHRAVHASAKSLEPFEVEIRLIGEAGEENWVRSMARPRRLDNGDVVWDGVTIDVTETRRAKEAEQRSQAEAAAARQQLLDAVESISDGFVLYDSDERLVLCNRKYRELYPGIADLLVPGMKLSDIVQAAMDRQEIVLSDVTPAQWIEARLKQYRSGQGSHEQNTADGRWILARETRTADGGIVGIRTDITEQKRRETALAESEARFRAITQTAPVAILISRVSDGQLLFCNPQFAELVGLPMEKVLGHRASEFYHDPEDRERLLSLLRDGRARNVEMRFKRADGKPQWAMFSTQQMVFGGEQALLSAIVDITDRKLAETELREVEERFRAVVDNQPNSIVFKDLDGVFRIVNKCWEEWFGISAEKALGKTVHDLFEKNIADELEKQDRRVLAERKVIDQEYVTPFADGALHTLDITKFPVFASDGRIIGVGAISIDVTQQRRAEAELSQAQKMEAIGHLTGGVAHDFNNLLTVILGHLELLEENVHDRPEDTELIRPARNAARRGAELTQRLLAFSRKQALQPQLTDLTQLVSGMTDLLRSSLGEAIEIRTLTTGQPWKTMVDPGQVENALLNLAINARDAMPQGGRLDIDTANVTLDEPYSGAPPGEYVSLAVTDSGIGMTSEIMRRAFEPFFTTKDVGKGTGLGLSTIYGFVKQSGGYVRISSHEGKGSKVTLCFPRAAADEDAGRATAAEREPATPGGAETILLVEDDDDIRHLATRILTGLGYKVVAAADGPDALQRLDEVARVDMLLTDVILPGGMSGRDVADEVVKRRPDIKTLFVSGHAEDVLAPHGVLPEGTALLKKPFTKPSLARATRGVLDQ